MTDLVEIVARALVPVTSGAQEDAYGVELPDKQFDDLTDDWQGAYRRYSQAALAAIKDAGFAVVPVEPTKAMVREGFDALENCGALGKSAHATYTAMIQAAGDTDND